METSKQLPTALEVAQTVVIVTAPTTTTTATQTSDGTQFSHTDKPLTSSQVPQQILTDDAASFPPSGH